MSSSADMATKRAEALELYATGMGYRRIGRQLGIARGTVQSWCRAKDPPSVVAARAGARTRARARTPAPTKPEPPPPAEPTDEVDPADQTPADFWAGRLRSCVTHQDSAMSKGNTRSAAEWGRLTSEARKHLDVAMALEAEQRAHQLRTEQRDPLEVADRVITLAPVLARLAPAKARELIEALTQELDRG